MVLNLLKFSGIRGDYKLVRKIEKINAVNKLLALNMFYWWLDHILSSTIQKLVHNSLATSLKLEETKETDIIYESYIYSKITQVLISKV